MYCVCVVMYCVCGDVLCVWCSSQRSVAAEEHEDDLAELVRTEKKKMAVAEEERQHNDRLKLLQVSDSDYGRGYYTFVVTVGVGANQNISSYSLFP